METTRVISDNTAISELSIGSLPLKNNRSPSSVAATGRAAVLRACFIRWRLSTMSRDVPHRLNLLRPGVVSVIPKPEMSLMINA